MRIGPGDHVALAFKLLALVALYILFFGPAHQTTITPHDTANHVLGG
jgi:hypothetical protein